MRKSFNSSQDNHSPVQLAEQTPWCAGASWERGERQPRACTLPHPSLLCTVHGLHCRPQCGVGALALALVLALTSPPVAPWLHEHSQACLSTSLCRKAAALGSGNMQSGAAGKGLLLLLLPKGPGGGQGDLGLGKRARSLLK